MTGSGACVFVAFPERVRAEAALAELRRAHEVEGFVAEGVDLDQRLGEVLTRKIREIGELL